MMEKELLELLGEVGFRHWRVTDGTAFVMFSYGEHQGVAGIDKQGDLFVGSYTYHLLDFETAQQAEELKQRIISEQKEWCLNTAVGGLKDHVQKLNEATAKEVLYVDLSSAKGRLPS